MKLFLGLIVTLICVGGVIEFNQSELTKFKKRETVKFQSVSDQMGKLSDRMDAIARDTLSLKTDYAEVEKLSDSFNSYTAARKDVPAFREFDELCGKVFMQLLGMEQELDARIKKLEGKKRH